MVISNLSSREDILKTTLTPQNQTPTITSPDRFDVDKDATVIGTIAASDGDGDPLTFSVTGGMDANLFSIDPNTGELTLNRTPNFVNITDTDSDGVFIVEITVDDGHGGTTRQSLAITFGNGNGSGNGAPIFTGTDLSIDENSTEIGVVPVSDPDGDSLTFSLTGGEDASFFTLGSNGELSFNNAPDFETPEDADGDNVYLVEITAGDSNGATAVETLAVTVDGVNEPPVFSLGSSLNVLGGTTEVTTVTATDPEGDPIVFSLTGGADAGLFTITDDGELSFISPPDFGSPTDADGDNAYEVLITADDGGGGTTERSLIVNVTNPSGNTPPFANDDSAIVTEGGTVTLDVRGNDSDVDGDPLSVAVSGAPANGNAIVDSGNIIYTPNPGFFGSDSFTYQLNDGNGGTDTATVSLTVREAAPLMWFNPSNRQTAYWEVTEGDIVAGQFLSDVIGNDWYLGGVGDFDFDGITDDVVWGNSGTFRQTALWDFQDGDLTEGVFDYAAVPSFSDPNWRVQAVGDFDNGGNPNDIVYRNIATGENAILSLEGTSITDFTSTERRIQALDDLAWSAKGVGDLDGDGQFDDIVWYNRDSGNVAIWNMEADTLVDEQLVRSAGGEVVTVSEASGWMLSGVSDLDSDGAADDLLWRNNLLEETAYWQMSGGQIEGEATITPKVFGEWTVVTGAVGEFSAEAAA